VAHPVDIHVGSRIRVRRLLLGMNQETLANRLGLTFQFVGRSACASARHKAVLYFRFESDGNRATS